MTRYITYLSQLSRPKKVALQIGADSALIVFALVCAVALRLETLALFGQPAVWAAVLAAALVTLLTFHILGLYRALVRFVTGKIFFAIAKGALVGSIALYIFGLGFGAGLPRSVPIIFGLFVVLLAGGLRFLVRTLFRNPAQDAKLPVIIYGAGDSGRQLLNSLFHGRDYGPVAFVDDNPNLQGLSMGGLRVYAPAQLPQLIQETGAHIILLAIPSIGRARRREIVSHLREFRVEIKTIPALSELIEGKAKISELRAVTPEDLLGRDPIEPNSALLAKNITGRVVMVSGAGGSIGSELCRQILNLRPKALVLFDVSEFAIYTLEAELSDDAARLQPSIEIFPLLGSVQNSWVLEDAIKAFGVQTIYHAAAYKHVPLVEDNVVEAIRNNAFGTLAIAAAAKKHGVENFILISTDKAVRPTNVMGATKRIAELICQAYAQEASRTVFSMVRFGNVLGSSGSVIPRFRAQIEAGGPLTVTHRDITRYFMTIPEAAQLVIQAGAMGKGGDVFVLDMGEPVKIMDLAIEMVKLHGLEPYFVEHPHQVFPEQGDIPICLTGLRKGEKLYEELLIGNNPAPTEHPRIMTASETALSMQELLPVLDRLRLACETIDLAEIFQILHELPLDYAPTTEKIAPWHMRSEDEEQIDLPRAIGAGA
jgi:FlaA1/EpsC-like NDP-sugar epimerase